MGKEEAKQSSGIISSLGSFFGPKKQKVFFKRSDLIYSNMQLLSDQDYVELKDQIKKVIEQIQASPESAKTIIDKELKILAQLYDANIYIQNYEAFKRLYGFFVLIYFYSVEVTTQKT